MKILILGMNVSLRGAFDFLCLLLEKILNFAKCKWSLIRICGCENIPLYYSWRDEAIWIKVKVGTFENFINICIGKKSHKRSIFLATYLLLSNFVLELLTKIYKQFLFSNFPLFHYFFHFANKVWGKHHFTNQYFKLSTKLVTKWDVSLNSWDSLMLPNFSVRQLCEVSFYQKFYLAFIRVPFLC